MIPKNILLMNNSEMIPNHRLFLSFFIYRAA